MDQPFNVPDAGRSTDMDMRRKAEDRLRTLLQLKRTGDKAGYDAEIARTNDEFGGVDKFAALVPPERANAISRGEDLPTMADAAPSTPVTPPKPALAAPAPEPAPMAPPKPAPVQTAAAPAPTATKVRLTSADIFGSTARTPTNRTSSRDIFGEDAPTFADPFNGENLGATTKRRGQQFVAGAVDFYASVPEALAITQAEFESNVRDQAPDQIKRAIGSAERIAQIMKSGVSPLSGQPMTQAEADTYQARMSQALTAIKSWYEQADMGVMDANKRPSYQTGDQLRQRSADIFGAPDPRDDGLWGQVATGAGSVAASLPFLAAGPGGSAAAGSVWWSQGASSAYKDAKQSGASEEDARLAAQFGGAIGWMELLPIQKAIEPISYGLKLLPAPVRKRITNVFTQALAKIAESSGEEAAQEYLSQVANNLVAQGIYDPDRGWDEGALESALVGGIIGGGLGGVGAAREALADRAAMPDAQTGPVDPALAVPPAEPAPAAPVADVAPPIPEPLAPEPLAPEPLNPGSLNPQQGADGFEPMAGYDPDTDAETSGFYNAQTGQFLTEEEYAKRQTPEAPPRPTSGDLKALLDDERPLSEIQAAEAQAQEDAAKVGTREAPAAATEIDRAAAQVAAPTPAQADAGNYKKGHVKVAGMDVALENAKGSERSGVDPDGKPWSVTMPAHYGYVKRSEGADGDPVDVYVGPNPESEKVWVVDQLDADTRKFDEHKVMLGYDSAQEALQSYTQAFSDGRGPARIGGVTPMSTQAFKAWLKDGDQKVPLRTLPKTVKSSEVFGDSNSTQISVSPEAETAVGAWIADRSQPVNPKKISERSGIPVAEITRALNARAAQGNGIRQTGKGGYRRIERLGPQDLVAYLARSGGIRDDEGHSLKKSRNMQRFVPKAGPLIRPKGMSIDEAGQALWDAGYFGDPDTVPRPTENDVLQALEDAIQRDKKIYSQDDQQVVEERAANEAAIRDADQYADMGQEQQPAIDPMQQALQDAEIAFTAILDTEGFGPTGDYRNQAIAAIVRGVDPDQAFDDALVSQIEDTVSREEFARVLPDKIDDIPFFNEAEDDANARYTAQEGQVPAPVRDESPDRPAREADGSREDGGRTGPPDGAARDGDAFDALFDQELDNALGPKEPQQAPPQSGVSDSGPRFTGERQETTLGTAEQTVIPGGERSAKQAAASRDGRLKGKVPQKGMDDGLFGTPNTTGDMFDAPKPAPLNFTLRGDFYEVTGNAARDVAKALGVVVASRDGAPMVGIPKHASAEAFKALERAGFVVSKPSAPQKAETRKDLVIEPVSIDTFRNWKRSVPSLGTVRGWTVFNDNVLSRIVLMSDEQQVSGFESEALAREWAAANPLSGKTAGQAAASAAKNVAMGIDDVSAGLAKLFGADKNRLGSGPSFDEDTYRQALPLFKAGVQHFKAAGEDLQALVRALVQHLVKNANMDRAAIEAMRPYLRRFTEDVQSGVVEIDDVPGPSESVESDRSGTEPANQVGAADVPAAGTGTERGAGKGDRAAVDKDEGPAGSLSLFDDGAPVVGGRGDSSTRSEASPGRSSPAGRGNAERSGNPGVERVSDDRTAAKSVKSVAAKSADLTDRKATQAAADKVAVVTGDLDNIAKTLPLLQDVQQNDVYLAEKRFEKPAGHGFLFTNGTGTGKTYTGMGIVKRFARQGKTNTLIVAPSQSILDAWVEVGRDLGLDISTLKDTKDTGKGIVATTYANLELNQHLVDRTFDLVVADESQNLMSNAQGEVTGVLRAFRAVTNNPSGHYEKATRLERELIKRIDALRDPKGNLPDSAEPLLQKLRDKREAHIERLQGEPRSKVVLLSATPFAYDKNVDYAEGYLFEYNEPRERGGYNQPDGRQAFFIQHFGYRMRTGKLTQPDADVNTEVMEREFHEWLRKEGVLEGRVLDVPVDYDRKFILTTNAEGQNIDRAMNWLNEAGPAYRPIVDAIRKRFDYLKRKQLLEAIKADNAIPIIREHLKMGRKVVVFHDYNVGGGFNPFAVSFSDDAVVNYTRDDGEPAEANLKSLLDEFKSANPYVKDLNFSSLLPPVDAILQSFPEQAVAFNGTISAKQRSNNKKAFNTDASGTDVIVVQSDAGGAGISLHDTTGKHQRVLINLGMPSKPVATIQQEGRIRRVGSISNAPFRYFNTGTDWERWTFASTIAERAGTAENLALGNQARALKQSFIDAFLESGDYPPSPQDGIGGKEADKADHHALNDFERAKTHYFAQQKKTSRNKATEGIDYFPTPEPVALKMVEWAGIKVGDRVLEPSAGHGAIARYFPESAARTLIEPSSELASRAALVSPGANVKQQRFEDLHITNKYDAIVMNPPFGSGGKTAFDHIDKAIKHLRNGGRVVALVPRGPAADKRLDRLKDGMDDAGIHLVADIDMPTVTFERAGTTVASRILVLEKQTDAENAAQIMGKQRDYASAESINELFYRIENLDLPNRLEPLTKDVSVSMDSDTITAGGHEFKLDEIKRDGNILYSATPKKFMGKGQAFSQPAKLAEERKGFWESTLKSFLFRDAESRLDWFNAIERGDKPASVAIDTAALDGPAIVKTGIFEAHQTFHQKRQKNTYVAAMTERVEADVYKDLVALAKTFPGGYYSSYKAQGAIPGFQFNSPEDRDAFIKAATTDGQSKDTVGGGSPAEIYRRTEEDMFAFADELEPKLRAALQTYGLSDKITLKFMGYMGRRDRAGRIVSIAQGRYTPARRLIEIATATIRDGQSASWVMDHEVIHALRDIGVLTQGEWGMLRSAALSDKPRMAEIRTRYRDQNLSEESLIEEAIADMFADWRFGRETRGLIAKAFDKIMRFLRALTGSLQATDVFADIEAGKVGNRTGKASSDGTDRFAETALGRDIAAFSKQLAEYLDNPKAWNPRKPLIMGETPYVLEQAGISKRKLEITPDVVEKVLGGKHSVQRETLESLLADLSRPLYVMYADQSLNPGKINILVGATDGKGESLMVGIDPQGRVDLDKKLTPAIQAPLAPDRTRSGVPPMAGRTDQIAPNPENVKAARIATVHSKDRVVSPESGGAGLEKHLAAKARDGDILYYDRAAVRDWAGRRGLSVPTQGDIRRSNPSFKTEGILKGKLDPRDRYALAYHGSPHDFDRFDLGAIGSGEGAQAYGWGLYFASKKEVAEHYRDSLSFSAITIDTLREYFTPGRVVRGKYHYDKVIAFHSFGTGDLAVDVIESDVDGRVVKGAKMRQHSTVPPAKEIERVLGKKLGRTYEVNIPDDSEYLLWDKPLSEQPENVRKALNNLPEDEVIAAWKKNGAWEKVSGEVLYKHLSDGMTYGGATSGKHRAASLELLAAGIPGIKYLDGVSRFMVDGQGTRTYNYVVFDAGLIDIQAKYSLSRNDGALPSKPAYSFLSAKNKEALRRFKEQGSAKLDRLRYVVQDKYIDVKRTQEGIAQARGGVGVSISENAYMAEELYHGRTGAKLNSFQKEMVEPLVEDIAARGLTLEQVEEYLYARHAPERNARIAKINPDLADGGSGMTDAEAQEILDKFKANGKTADLQAIARQVDAITRRTMKERVDAGLLSQEEADVWQGAYEHYVPLRGFAELADEDDGSTGMRIGRGFDTRGKESQQALGRTSRAADLLVNVLTAHEEAIVRGEKNRVGQAFLEMAKNNPDESLWEVQKVEIKRRLNKKTGLVETTRQARTVGENVLAVKVEGKTYHVTIHHSGMAKAMKNVGADTGNQLIRLMQTANRWLAFVNTSANPEFVISNMARDLQTAGINLQQYGGQKGLTRAVFKGIPKALGAARSVMRDKGEHEWAHWFNEFAAEGGKTEFFGLDTLDQKRKRIQAQIDKIDPSNLQKMAQPLMAMERFIQDYNSVVENGVRLSTYIQMRERGISKAQAASAAKNLTVNFNRRGSMGPTFGALYLFYNASIQGTVIMMQALKHKRVQQAVAGVVILNIILDVINGMVSPEDEDDERAYDKIPDYTRSHNLIFVNPWAGPEDDPVGIKIPMPYGYNVFANMGRNIGRAIRAGMGFGPSDYSAMSDALDLAAIAVESFNPIGGETDLMRTIVPTILKPFDEIRTNENFAGIPIMPEQNPYGAPRPDYQRYFRSAPGWAKGAAEFLFENTGNSQLATFNIDVSPETLDHMASFVTGASGAFWSRSYEAAKSVLSGDAEDLQWNDIPFARKLVEGKNIYWRERRYFDIREAGQIAKQEIKPLRGEERSAYTKTYRAELLADQLTSSADKSLKEMRKARRAIENAKALSDDERKRRIEAINERMDQVYLRVLSRYSQAVQGQ